MLPRWTQKLWIFSLAGISLVPCWARTLHAQDKPKIGSTNVTIADPHVPRPATKPCVVKLFNDERFGDTGANTRMDAVPHTYAYQPPRDCKGPFAKIVLEASFAVDPGHQYDRTASIWLNGVNLYFGTTEEPSPQFGPSWSVERDLTDYTSMLRSPGKGAVLVNNWVDEKRASMIHGSAQILFYPAGKQVEAPRVPDEVYSLNGETNAAADLQSSKDTLTRTMAFPRNVARVYLDLFTQSQFHDEFWYTCLLDKYIEQTTAFAMKRGYAGAPVRPRACSGGSYREAEVSIDGQPAGLAPVYPWVYTGGIDPYLWRPTPGVQTLNFIPYRMDLTPFAGLLSDGAQHAVAVRVMGANQYFSVAGALLIYRDKSAKHTGGAITRNTLIGVSLEPNTKSTLVNDPSKVNGDVKTEASQDYVIEGYINTPSGRVSSSVEQTMTFGNTQAFTTIDAQTYRQVTSQAAHTEQTSRSTGPSIADTGFHQTLDYLLKADVLKHSNQDDSQSRKIDLQQSFDKRMEGKGTGSRAYSAAVHNARSTADEATFNAAHTGGGDNTGQHSTQTFSFRDSLGDCYQAEVQASGGAVSSYTEGQGCSASPMRWYVHPDGSPDSLGWRLGSSR